MPSFFKTFFASLLAFVVFWIIVFFFVVALGSALASGEKPQVADKSVLVLDLSTRFSETERNDPLGRLTGGEGDAPGLYDVTRLIRHAAEDKNIVALYVKADGNANSYAASEQLRRALTEFRSKGKPVIARGDQMTQSAYFVATAANRLYLGPAGQLEWKGLAMELAFFKNALEKLQIEPQIFYAGKFKSATEPFRAERMTPENRIQMTELLNDLYQVLLRKVSEARGIDTAALHRLANEGRIQNARDALDHKLVDGLRYDDEVREELKRHTGSGKTDKLSLVTMDTYSEAVAFREKGKDRIGLLYAEGTIVDGKGDQNSIGDEDYVKMIRKLRLDKSIRAIVFRINSGGGSALASENIWRELRLAKAEKPVVVSFGDVAASGGYYIATPADSIFAESTSITGSIGVFTMIPNMKGFFGDKLGITFDGVKTATYADDNNVFRPLTEQEKAFQQNEVERIYGLFKQRVAEGRRRSLAYVDSIAQGRVWSGNRALQLGLVDRIGSLEDAVRCAARLAKTSDYRLREFPEQGSWVDEILNRKKEEPAAELRRQLGAEQFAVYQQLVQIRQLCQSPQARLPFQYTFR